jgi:hypothetical protein
MPIIVDLRAVLKIPFQVIPPSDGRGAGSTHSCVRPALTDKAGRPIEDVAFDAVERRLVARFVEPINRLTSIFSRPGANLTPLVYCSWRSFLQRPQMILLRTVPRFG